MSATPWMPFYPADYLADTRRLTTEQHGAYLLLLLDSWVSGALPDDDAVLSRVAGLDAERWAQVRPVIAGYFQIADGQWTHARIEREREHAQAHAQASSERAKKAAASRWGKKQQPESTEKTIKSVDNHALDASSNACALLDECPPQPQPQYKTPVVNDDVDNSGSSASASTASSSFAEPAGMPEQNQRAAADAQRARAGELCKLLRRQGLDAGLNVAAQPGNPQVLHWVAAGVTDDEAVAACETALLNRRAQGSQQPITAGYLDTIIAASRAAKTTGAQHATHRSRAAAAAAWGAEFAAEIGGATRRPPAERCIDGEAVTISAGQAVG